MGTTAFKISNPINNNKDHIAGQTMDKNAQITLSTSHHAEV